MSGGAFWRFVTLLLYFSYTEWCFRHHGLTGSESNLHGVV